jgi:hypothetical protein
MTPEQLAAELVTVEQRGPAAVQCYSVLVAGVVVRGLLDGGRARTLAGEVRAALAARLAQATVGIDSPGEGAA